MQNKKGAFLLEALMIVVILSISLTSIIGALVSSLRASVYSADYTKAVLLAENKLFSLMKNMSIEESFKGEGSFDVPFDKFRYQVQSQGVAFNEHCDFLQEVHVNVLWSTGSKEGFLSLTTLLLTDRS